MKIFLDSAEVEHIVLARSYGVLDGVTTNPSLIKKAIATLQAQGEQVDMHGYIHKLLQEARDVPVSLEVIGADYESMVQQGRFLYQTFNPVAGNVVIKIPVNPALKQDSTAHFDGLRAIRTLSEQGIPVNCTLVFTPEQALLAAKSGAAMVSPFAGRVDDMLRTQNGLAFAKTDYFPADGLEQTEVTEDNGIVSGIDLVAQCVEIMHRYRLSTEVLAASLRNPRQTREAALVGAHIATLPFEVINSLLLHDKTMQGMQAFLDDVVPEYAQLLQGQG